MGTASESNALNIGTAEPMTRQMAARVVSLVLAFAAWLCTGLPLLAALFWGLAGAALFVCVLLRRAILAAVATIVGLSAMFVLANAFSTDWIDHLGRQEPIVLLVLSVGVSAPILAVLLARV